MKLVFEIFLRPKLFDGVGEIFDGKRLSGNGTKRGVDSIDNSTPAKFFPLEVLSKAEVCIPRISTISPRQSWKSFLMGNAFSNFIWYVTGESNFIC